MNKGRGGPRTPGPGKKIGRPKSERTESLHTKVIPFHKFWLMEKGRNAAAEIEAALAEHIRRFDDIC